MVRYSQQVELRIEQDDHGHEVKVGLATLKIFKEADSAVEWACDELLRSKHQFNMMLPDPKTGKFTAKIIFRNILTYIKLGFGALVAGEEFDSATFRKCVPMYMHTLRVAITAPCL